MPKKASSKRSREVSRLVKHRGTEHELPSVAFLTLGCKTNQYENQAMAEELASRNFRIVSYQDKADVCIINTCTVTGRSDKKSRQYIRHVIRSFPKAYIVVTGCYAQANPDRITQIPGVDLVLGNSEKNRIAEYLEMQGISRSSERKRASYLGRPQKSPRPQVFVEDIMICRQYDTLLVSRHARHTRAFLKIQDGCNHFCSFCRVPYVRGPSRSRKLYEILNEVVRLAQNGFKEVVLTGINLGSFGNDGSNLAKVIEAIPQIDGIQRIRLSSIEPVYLTKELIEAVSSLPKVCSYLHIPLQSGSDRILKAMKRPYTTGEYSRLIDRIRSEIHEAGIGTDIMVGFPGETDKDFEDSYEFCAKMGFSRMHVFKYSRREGTRAANLPDQISNSIKTKRAKELLNLAREQFSIFSNQFLGRRVLVLVERINDNDYLEGLTDNYIRTLVKGPDRLINEIVEVRITKIGAGYVIGEVSKGKGYRE